MSGSFLCVLYNFAGVEYRDTFNIKIGIRANVYNMRVIKKQKYSIN